MAIRDFAGVFSRYFIVGFFLPLFFAAASLDQVTGGSLFPSQYQQHTGIRLLIIGAFQYSAG